MQNKYLISPECVCEVLAQNTRQIIFYSLLKLPLLESSVSLVRCTKCESLSAALSKALIFTFRVRVFIIKSKKLLFSKFVDVNKVSNETK